MRPILRPHAQALCGAVSPLALLVGLGLASGAHAGPQGGVVTRGSAGIGTAAAVTTVDQASPRAVIEWQSFDVNADETVRFRQPDARSVTLNRVGGEAPSDIAGRIDANGHVWVLNRNGVLIRDTAQINVGGFVASSLDIADDAFMGGSNRLTEPGAPDARVINEGSITFGQAGLVGLIGPHAENRGTITGTLGSVVVGGRAGLAVDLAGDGLIAFEVAPEALAGVDAASAGNAGAILAPGSRVVVTAAEAAALVDSVVSMEGVITADTLGAARGTVEIAGGDVAVQGTVRARGTAADSDGGTVAVTGRHVTVSEGARIEADGARAGGRVDVIGGESGSFGGFITVAGGTQGGFVDTSAPDLRVSGFVDASAGAGGTAGLWLIDPVNWVIGETVGDNVLDFGTVNIEVGAIRDALEGGTSVTLTTAAPAGSTVGLDGNDPAVVGPVQNGAGFIRMVPGLTALGALDINTADVTLRFEADAEIRVASPIRQTSGGFGLSLDFDAATTISMDSGSGFVPLDVRGTIALTAATAIETGQITTTAPLGALDARPIRLTAPSMTIDSGALDFNTTGLGFGGLGLSGGEATVRAANIETFGASALSGVTTATLTDTAMGPQPLRVGSADTVTIGMDDVDVLNLEAPGLGSVATLTVRAESRAVEAVQAVDRGDLTLALTTTGPALGFAVVEGVGLTLSALSVDVTGPIAIGGSAALDIGGLARFETLDALTVEGAGPSGTLRVGGRLELIAESLAIAPLKFGGGFTQLDVTRTGATDFEVGPGSFDPVRLKNTGTTALATARVAAPGASLVVRGVDAVTPPGGAGVPIATVLLEAPSIAFEAVDSAFTNLSLVATAGDAAAAAAVVTVDDTLALRAAGDVRLRDNGTALRAVTGLVGGDLALDSATPLTLRTLHVGGAAELRTDGALVLDTVTLGSGPDPAALPIPAANALTAMAESVSGQDVVAGDTRFVLSVADGVVDLNRFDVARLGVAVPGGSGFPVADITLTQGTVRGVYAVAPAPDTLTLDAVRFTAPGALVLSAVSTAQLDRVATAGELSVDAAAIRLGRVAVDAGFTAVAGVGGVVKLPDATLVAAPPPEPITAVIPTGASDLTLAAPLAVPDTGPRAGFGATFDRLLDITGQTALTASGDGDILLPSASLGGVFRDNRFSDTVDATGRDIAIEAGGALALGRVVATRDLALRSNATANGSAGIGQTGGPAPAAGLDVTGTAAFITGRHGDSIASDRLANVVLDNPANRFGGAVSVLAADARIAAATALEVVGASTGGNLVLRGATGLAVRDAVVAAGLDADGGTGAVDVARVRVEGALPSGRGVDARADGAVTLRDLDAAVAGGIVATAGGAAAATGVLHDGISLSGSTVAIDGAAGGGGATAVGGSVTLRALTAATVAATATAGDIMANGVAATAGALRLEAAGDVLLGTVFSAQTVDMAAGGRIATMPGALPTTSFAVTGAQTAALGFDTNPATGDGAAIATRVREAGLAGSAGGGGGRTFDGLVVAGGAARFEAAGEGIALVRQGGLNNRFANTLALYAPQTGAPTAVVVEAGKAVGQSVGSTPLLLGRFPGETRDAAVDVPNGSLTLRNDFAILDADNSLRADAPGAIVVRGGASFSTQDWNDAARFHDVALDLRDAHSFGSVSIDAEDIYLDAGGSGLLLGDVRARATSNDMTAEAAGLRLSAADRILTLRSTGPVSQVAGTAITVQGSDSVPAPLAEITAARTDGSATTPADITLDQADNDVRRLSVVGDTVAVRHLDPTATAAGLTLERSVAASALAVETVVPLSLDRVRVGGATPVAGNTLTATAPAIAAMDIDAGDTSLILTAEGAAPGLTRFRTQDLRVGVAGVGTLARLDLTDGLVAGVFRPVDPGAGTPPAAIGTLAVTTVTFGDGATTVGAANNPRLAASDVVSLDGVRAGGLLHVQAADDAGTVRLGRLAAGALDVAAGAGGVVKIADADLPPLQPFAIARFAAAEPAAADEGRAPEALLTLPVTSFTRLLDVTGTTALGTSGGGDILLPSVAGGPSGPLHNRFGGAVSLAAGESAPGARDADAALEAQGAILLGAVDVEGRLAVRSNAANAATGPRGIGQTGAPMRVAGDAAFMTGRHGGAEPTRAFLADVALAGPANEFGGALGVIAENATIAAMTPLTVANSVTARDMALDAPSIALSDSLIGRQLRLDWADTADLRRVRVDGAGTAVDASGGDDFIATDLAAPEGTLRVRADTASIEAFIAGRLDIDATGALALADGVVGQGTAAGGTVGRLFHLRSGAAPQGGIDPALATGDLSVVARGGSLQAVAVAASGELTLEAEAGDIVLDRVRAGTLRADAAGSVLSAGRPPAAAEALRPFSVEGPSVGVIGLPVADGAGMPETGAGGRVRDRGEGIDGVDFDALAFDRLVATTGRARFAAAGDVVVVRETVPTITGTLDPSQLHNAFGAVDIVTGAGRLAAVEVAGGLDLAGVQAGRLAARSDSEGASPFGGIAQSGALNVDGVASFIVGHPGGLPHGVPPGPVPSAIPFNPVGAITLANPANSFGSVQAVGETVDIRSAAGFTLFQSRVGGTLSVTTGAGAGTPLVIRDSLVRRGAQIAAASPVELRRVGVGGTLEVTGSGGDLTLGEVHAAGDAALIARSHGVDADGLDIGADLQIAARRLGAAGMTVGGVAAFETADRAALSDIRTGLLVGRGGDVRVVDADVAGFDLTATDGPVLVRRLTDRGGASAITATGSITVVDVSVAGSLRLVTSAGDIGGDDDGLRVRVGGDFSATSSGGDVRLAAAPRPDVDAIGSVVIAGDAVVGAARDASLIGAIVSGNLSIEAGRALTVAGVDVAGRAALDSGVADGSEPALQIVGLRAAALETDSRGGQRVALLDAGGNVRLVEHRGDIVLGAMSVGGALDLVNTAPAGGVRTGVMEAARSSDLAGPVLPTGGGFSTVGAPPPDPVVGAAVGALLPSVFGPLGQVDQKRVTETVLRGSPRIVPPFAGGQVGGAVIQPVAIATIDVGGETRIDVAGDVAIADLRPLGADGSGSNGNRFRGGLLLARVGGSVLVDGGGNPDSDDPLVNALVVRFGADGDRPGAVTQGQDATFILRDGAGLVFPETVGAGTDNRLGRLTVVGADGVTFAQTSGVDDDDILFARDLVLVNVRGAVTTAGERDPEGQLEIRNSFGGVNLTGAFEYSQSPGLARIDLTGALGPDGLRTRAAGLRPTGGSGPDFLFNLCIIGNIADCSGSLTALTVPQLQFLVPDIFDLDLATLADVYAGFGNEELWALIPVLLEDLEETAP